MGPLPRLEPEGKMRSRILYLTALLATIFLVLLLAATLATRGTKASPGTTLYVSTTGDDLNDCTSSITPCRTVQHAFDMAQDGDEILVAAGTYTGIMKEYLPAWSDFVTATVVITKNIAALMGGYSLDFASRDPNANVTTLSAAASPEDFVIFITATNTVIDGFTVTGSNGSNTWYGAGIRVNGGKPTLSHNRIQGNTAPLWGGGIYVTGNAAPTISANLIYSNTAEEGAGIYIRSGASVITGNVVVSNTAAMEGGGIFVNNAPVTIVSNTIAYNQTISTTGARGGGIRTIGDSAIVTVSHNEVYSNSLVSGFGGGIDISSPAVIDSNYVHHNQGDGIIVADSPLPVTVTNNVIVWNYVTGIVGCNFSDVRIVNNTIYHNSALGVDVFAWPTTPTIPITATILNNIVVNHEDDCGINGWNGVTLVADYNDSYGNQWDYCGLAYPPNGTHNVSADPLFVDPSAWDYHIQVASPAINKGTFTGAPSTDFEGDARPYDCFIDIGADENTASDYCQRIYLPLILKNY